MYGGTHTIFVLTMLIFGHTHHLAIDPVAMLLLCDYILYYMQLPGKKRSPSGPFKLLLAIGHTAELMTPPPPQPKFPCR